MHRLARSRQIAETLSRNGLRALAAQSGLSSWLPSRGDTEDSSTVPTDVRPDLLVKTLQELGTVYIKLGQVLSMRRDLLPPAYCDALSALTDAAPVVPVADIKQVIAEEFDADPDTLFTTFDDEPLGSASVGQVHAAVLPNGQEAVVKVRKPGVTETVEDDLALLGDLARTLERHNTQIKGMGLVEVLDEFADNLRAEVDLTTEARVCQDMADRFADESIHVPWIDPALTTSRVVTQERVGGLRLDDPEALTAAGLDRATVAKAYVDALMRMVFEFGQFHADPHAGNVFVGPDGTLTFIDWGMVGTLNSRDQDRLMRVVAAFASGGDTLLLSALLSLAPPRHRLDEEKLRRDVSALADKLRTNKLQDISMLDLAEDVSTISREHGLNLSTEFSLLVRMLAVADGLARIVDPNLAMADVANEHAKRYLQRQLQPARLTEWLEEQLGERVMFAHDLPAQLRRILDRVESGEIDINVRDDVLKTSLDRLDRITTRLVTGMAVSAGMIASTLLVLARRRRK